MPKRRKVAKFSGIAGGFKPSSIQVGIVNGLEMWVTVAGSKNNNVVVGAASKRGLMKTWKSMYANVPDAKHFQHVIMVPFSNQASLSSLGKRMRME